MDQRYSDAVREAAIRAVMVDGEHELPVAERMGIPRSTLRGWLAPLKAARDVMNAYGPQEQRAVKSELAERWLNIQRAHLDLLDQSLDTLPVPTDWKSHRDLVVSAGVSADKHFDYTEGRRGATVNIDLSQQLEVQERLRHLTPDQLQALADQALADRRGQVIDSNALLLNAPDHF